MTWGAHPRSAWSYACSAARYSSTAATRRLTTCSSRQAELQEDRADVLLDRLLGQHEVLGDRGIALALRHLPEHLALARRQLVERAAAGGPAGDEQPHHGRIEHGAAVGDRLDRRVQLATDR